MWKPQDENKFWLDRSTGMTRNELGTRHGGTLRQVKLFLEKSNKPSTSEVATKSNLVNNEQIVETKDTLSIAINKTSIHTLDELLEYAQVDTSIWEVERFVVNKWEGFIKIDSDSRAGFDTKVQPLFQVKATLKKKKEVVNLKKIYNELKDDLKNYSPTAFGTTTRVKSNDGKLLQICIADHHLGKLCWGEEVGNDYDLKIAKKTYCDAVNDLLQ